MTHVLWILVQQSLFLSLFLFHSVTTTTTVAATTWAAPTIVDNCTASGVFMNASISPKYIYSPGYANGTYPSNKLCRWYITAPDNYAVEAYFDNETYGIESNSYCRYDYVTFYDGNSTTDSMLNKFCGSVRPTAEYRSSSTLMLIVFYSDYIIQKAGFKIRIRAVDNTYPGCKSDYTEYAVLYNRLDDYVSNNSTFINNITSPGFGTSDYPFNVEIYWLFYNANTTGYRIVLDIISISIERSYNCIYDRLILYNGPCIKDGILDTLCGYWKKQWDLEGPEYLLHFHSDGYLSQSGFLINYYAEEKTVPVEPTTSTTTFGPPVGAVVAAVKEMLTNYSNENLPARDLSEPIRAYVDFYFVGINGLDEVSQRLTSIGQFEVSWEDPSLTWDPTKRQGVVQVLLPQNDLWKPDIALINGFSKIKAMGAKFMFIDTNYNGSCIWKPYQVMDSVCQVDLTHFPYDRQVCTLKFGTWSSDDSQVITELGNRGLQMHPNFQENAEWRLISTETKQVLSSQHKIVEFHITLERNSLYVTYYMTIPIIMLAYMNVFVFVVPCESGEKTGYSITIFLSFVVLLIINNQSLPNNSDTISLFAAYVLTMTIMSAIALIISTIQIRAIAFDEKIFPISKRVKRCIRFISKIESFFQWDDSDDDTELKRDKSDVVELGPYKKESPTEIGSSGYGSSTSASKKTVVFKIDLSGTNDTEEIDRYTFPRNRPVNKITFERQTTLFEEDSLMRRSDTPSVDVHPPINDSHRNTELVKETSISKFDTSLNSDISNIEEISDQYTTNENIKENKSLIYLETDTQRTHYSTEHIDTSANDKENDLPFYSKSETQTAHGLSEHSVRTKNDKKDTDSLFDSEPDSPRGQVLPKEYFTFENEKKEIDSVFDQESDTFINNDSKLISNSNDAPHEGDNLNHLEKPTIDSDTSPKIRTVEGALNMQDVEGDVINQRNGTQTQPKTEDDFTGRSQDHNDRHEYNIQAGSLRDEITELQPVTANVVKMNRPISATENRALSLNKYVSRGDIGSASTKHGRALSASSSRTVSTKDNSRVISVLSKRPLSFVSNTRPASEISHNGNTHFLFGEEEKDDIKEETDKEEDNESGYSNGVSNDDFKTDTDTESLEEEEEEEEDDENEEDPSWSDLVACTDIIFFIFYLLVTTVLSLAFFLTMVLAY